MGYQKQETTVYVKEQTAKGAIAVVGDADAIQITDKTTLVKPQAAEVESPVLRPRGSRLPPKKYAIGKWGIGDHGVIWHGSGTPGTPPEFGVLLKNLLGTEVTNAAGTVEAGSGAVGGFDSALDLTVGQAVRVAIGAGYEIRLISGKSGSGTYTYTVDRDFAQAPADSAEICAGVSYIIGTTDKWLTVDQYEDKNRYLASDVRCRSLKWSLGAKDIVAGVFGLKALTCEESDVPAGDPNNFVWDDRLPFVGASCTMLIGGSSVNVKSLEFDIEVPKEVSYVNDNGLSDLPGDSNINASGTVVREMLGVSPLSAFFSGTLADVVWQQTSSDGDIGFVQFSDVQNGRADAQDEDDDLQWSVPFTITGGICIGFF
ncbi:MAG: hypothetical protein AB7D06_08925 [Pedobacter sp.]